MTSRRKQRNAFCLKGVLQSLSEMLLHVTASVRRLWFDGRKVMVIEDGTYDEWCRGGGFGRNHPPTTLAIPLTLRVTLSYDDDGFKQECQKD